MKKLSALLLLLLLFSCVYAKDVFSSVSINIDGTEINDLRVRSIKTFNSKGKLIRNQVFNYTEDGWKAENDIRYSYFKNGNLKKESDLKSDYKIKYSYKENTNLLYQKKIFGHVIFNYRYDARNFISYQSFEGINWSKKIRSDYDQYGRIIHTITDETFSGKRTINEYIYKYDNLKRHCQCFQNGRLYFEFDYDLDDNRTFLREMISEKNLFYEEKRDFNQEGKIIHILYKEEDFSEETWNCYDQNGLIQKRCIINSKKDNAELTVWKYDSLQNLLTEEVYILKEKPYLESSEDLQLLKENPSELIKYNHIYSYVYSKNGKILKQTEYMRNCDPWPEDKSPILIY